MGARLGPLRGDVPLGLAGRTFAQPFTFPAARVMAPEQRLPDALILMSLRTQPTQIESCGIIRRDGCLGIIFAYGLWDSSCLPLCGPRGSRGAQRVLKSVGCRGAYWCWSIACRLMLRHAGL